MPFSISRCGLRVSICAAGGQGGADGCPKGDAKSDAALVDQLQTHAAEEEASLQQEISSGPTVPK